MKLVAFEVPSDWDLDEVQITVEGGMGTARKHTDPLSIIDYSSPLRTDVIALGEQYSSANYKIITETEGDHMLFKVVSRKDV